MASVKKGVKVAGGRCPLKVEMSISQDLLNHHEATQSQRSFFTVPHGPRVAFHEECSHKGQERRNKKPPDVASTREASSCDGAKSIGVTDTCPDGALIDARARHAVIFVAGVASTREASRCVGANRGMHQWHVVLTE